MLLVTDYYERGSLYDYLQITVLHPESMARSPLTPDTSINGNTTKSEII